MDGSAWVGVRVLVAVGSGPAVGREQGVSLGGARVGGWHGAAVEGHGPNRWRLKERKGEGGT